MTRLLAVPLLAAALLAATACADNDAGATSPATTTATATPAAATSAPADDYATFPIGPGKHTVLLHSYNESAHSVVVEPASFGSDDQGPPVIEGEKTEYTLPVRTDVKISSVGGGNPDCMAGEGYAIAGTCPADAGWLQEQLESYGEGFPVQLTNTSETVDEIAELYRP